MTQSPTSLAFFAIPEAERCQAGLRGCTGGREVRLHCIVEGIDITVCATCVSTWRLNATSFSLYNRCPRCALWNPGARAIALGPADKALLTGAVADVVNEAMHAEGLMIDVRSRVLERLAHNASWLGDVQKP